MPSIQRRHVVDHFKYVPSKGNSRCIPCMVGTDLKVEVNTVETNDGWYRPVRIKTVKRKKRNPAPRGIVSILSEILRLQPTRA